MATVKFCLCTFRTTEYIMMRNIVVCCALLVLIVGVHAEVRYIASALAFFQTRCTENPYSCFRIMLVVLCPVTNLIA